MTKMTLGMTLQALLLASLFADTTLAAGTRVQVGKPAPDFELEDAEERKLKLSDTRGQVALLLIVAEADSKEQRQKNFKAINSWVNSIKERYAEKLLLLGLAKIDVSFLFKGKARQNLLKMQSTRFLIDWDGDAYAPYGDKQLPTIVLIDPQGIVRDRVVGNLDDNLASRLFAKIDSVLREG